MYIYPPLISSVLFIALGTLVLFHNVKSAINRTFFLLCLTTFGWQFTWFILFLLPDVFPASVMVKVGYSWIIFLPIAYFHFGMRFIKAHEEKNTIRVAYSLGFIFLIMNWFSDYFINGFFDYSWGYYPRAGILHPLYLLMLACLAVRGIYKGICKVRCEQDAIVKNQIKYIIIAFAFYMVAAVDFAVNYSVEFYPPGFIFILISLAIIAYAIVRHQLMDIEVVIKKTLVFAGLFGFVFSVIVVVAMLTQEFIAGYFPHSRFIALAISAVIIVFLQQSIYNFLIKITNKYLFQKKYDTRKVLNAFSNEALTILNLDKLCKITIDTLVKNLYLSNCAILLLSRDETRYEVYDSSGLSEQNVYYLKENSFISCLKATQMPVLYHSYVRDLQASEQVKEEMDKIQSKLCAPLVIHKDIVGILSLGAKKSDQPYVADDVDILTTLAKALSIAISNARLFAQAAQYEKLATIGTLASGINHEVCNPLNNMSTRMQIFIANLDRGAYKNKTQDELLKEVRDMIKDSIAQIHKVAGITGKLSNFAKPTKTVSSKSVNISQSIEDALGVLGHKLLLDKIEIIKNMPQDLPDILADEDQMQQIFFNLIRNAAQAIKEEGKITINAKEESGNIIIEVSDTGSGIPEDKLDKIFEPFYTTKADGSGYGLSIVREVIWRNRGEIKVKSQLGKGTTFYLEFPKA